MGWILWILSVCHGGQALPVSDLVEINHVTHGGKESFTQLLAWEWSPQHRRFNCQQWVIIVRHSRQGSVTCGETGSGETIMVQSGLFRETWTDHDPERDNAKLFNEKFRRKVW